MAATSFGPGMCRRTESFHTLLTVIFSVMSSDTWLTQQRHNHLSGAKIGSFSQAVTVAPSDLEPSKGDIVAHQNKTSKSQKPATKFEIDITRTGAEQLTERVNHAIVKLLCVCGVPPTIVDSDEWKNLMHTLNPRYRLTPSTQFVEKFIPREAAHVRQLMAERLQKHDNLTLTFDGNSTRNADSIYLVHYTTPDDRRSYLVHGYKGSDERHTREWVKGIIVKVCNLFWIPWYMTFDDQIKDNQRRWYK